MVVYKLSDNVRFYEKNNGQAVIENVVTMESATIGGAGIEIVKLIDGKRDLDDILEELCKMYGPNVEPYTLAQDIGTFIGDLLEADAIKYVKTTKK